MKKSDLKSGMILETRNGKRYFFINNEMLGVDGFLRFSSYYEDLKNKIVKDYDVIKVYKGNQLKSLQNILEDEYLTLIWERKEIELTKREVEFLKDLQTLGFEFLVRNKNGMLYVSKKKPKKQMHYFWYSDELTLIDKDLFTFIKWEDDEPTNINELLKER